jgi:hypothetical protein
MCLCILVEHCDATPGRGNEKREFPLSIRTSLRAARAPIERQAMLSTGLYKVTVQATAVSEVNWKVVSTGTWTPGQAPLFEEAALCEEVIDMLFNVPISAIDPSSRNQVRFGDIFYAAVFRRVSKRPLRTDAHEQPKENQPALAVFQP